MKKLMCVLGIVLCFVMVITINVYADDQKVDQKKLDDQKRFEEFNAASNKCHDIVVQKGLKADILNTPKEIRRPIVLYWFNQCMEENYSEWKRTDTK